MNIVLCDSAVHPTPVLRGWFYGLDQLGYNPKYLPIPNYSITQLTEEPDVLIYPYIEENLLSDFEFFKKRFPLTKIIGCRDDWSPFNLKLKYNLLIYLRVSNLIYLSYHHFLLK